MIQTINKQIAFLRRTHELTQEQLAEALGVTNQAVSKWESGQCCPDITLLPEIASFFGVSIDELMGHRPVDTSGNWILTLRESMDALPDGVDFALALKTAYSLHAIILSKYMTMHTAGNPGWDTDGAIEHAGRGEWGYSNISLPGFTTVFSHGSVLFSDNRTLNLPAGKLREIARIATCFSQYENLAVLTALYELTISDESKYADIPAIAEACRVPEERVVACLSGALSVYIDEETTTDMVQYRIRGSAILLVPVLRLLSMH